MVRHFSASPPGIWNHIVNNFYGCRIATGSYTGDGAISQAITGVGFQPKHLMIFIGTSSDLDDSVVGFTNDSLMSRNVNGILCVVFAASAFYRDNRVLSLDADGFTVSDDGGNSFPNTAGSPFDFTAWG